MKYQIRFFLLLSWCVMLVMTATAQSWEWRNLTPATGDKPAARRNGAAVYDPVGKRLIVFGGAGESGLLNDTWAFSVETNTWTKLSTTGTPPSVRFAFDAVYDSVGQQLVVYSGQGAGFLNDTWTLNLATLAWRDVSPANENARPKRRYGSASIFDPATRSLVQFAGFTSEAGRFQDTQSFGLANNAWTDWTPTSVKPQIRCLLTAAYDRSGRRMMIYGGQRNGPLDDLWAFDLASRTWTDLTPTTRPAGRWFASSFVDAAGNFLIFGGQGSSVYDELWSYNFAARQWTRLNVANGPSARYGAMSAYDEANDRWYVMGGGGNGNLNDVWVLQRQRQVANVTTVSSASYTGERLAPESIATAFGAALATTTQAAATNPLPTTLQGTSVRVKDSLGMERAAPLFFISPNQINFQVPQRTAFGAATINIYSGETLLGAGAFNVVALSPGLFTANGDGRGAPAAILFRVLEDFSHTTENLLIFDTASNRWVSKIIDLGKEKEEVFLILYGTGVRFNNSLESVTATIGGIAAPVSFASAQGSLTGLDQLNLRIPRALIGRGEVTVEINVSGFQTNPVRITVK